MSWKCLQNSHDIHEQMSPGLPIGNGIYISNELSLAWYLNLNSHAKKWGNSWGKHQRCCGKCVNKAAILMIIYLSQHAKRHICPSHQRLLPCDIWVWLFIHKKSQHNWCDQSATLLTDLLIGFIHKSQWLTDIITSHSCQIVSTNSNNSCAAGYTVLWYEFTIWWDMENS